MPGVQPRLAAAVMLLQASTSGQGMEVFMVRRSVQSEFVPDVYVFPGGSVMTDDCIAEQIEGICMPVAPTRADPEGGTSLGNGVRVAAIREVFEEANVLLAYREDVMLAVNAELVERFAAYRQAFNEHKGSLMEMAQVERLILATDCLAYFAHWITPEPMPKRYDTHFFLAAAPAEQEALYDRLETSDGVWIQPEEALKRFEQKRFPIVFATYHQLRDLTTFHHVDEAIAATTTRYVPTYMPIIEVRDSKRHVYLADNPASGWIV